MMHAPVRPGSLAPPHREAPQNIELEQVLLGAVLVNNAAYAMVADIIKPADFCEGLHGQIFEIAARLISDGSVATPITIKQFLPEMSIGTLSVSAYLARLAAEATTVINAADYAKHIADLSLRRKLILIGEGIVNAAYDPNVEAPPESVIEEAELQLYGLNAGGRERTTVWAEEAIEATINRASKIWMGECEKPGIATGLADLDDVTGGGLKRGNLVIVAGRPGMGKSLFAGSVSRMAATRRQGVHFFSLEMSADEISTRWLADQVFDRGDPRNPIRFVLAGREFRDLPLRLDNASSLSVAEIAARVRAEKTAWSRRNRSLDLVVVDYLKLIKPGGAYSGQRHYEGGEITRGLKVLARAMNVCVLLLAQINRGPEARDNKRPLLSDLRESGDIEADADVVLASVPRCVLSRPGSQCGKRSYPC